MTKFSEHALERLGTDTNWSSEGPIDREDHLQPHEDGQREQAIHQHLSAKIYRAEEEREAHRYESAKQQHCPDFAGNSDLGQHNTGTTGLRELIELVKHLGL